MGVTRHVEKDTESIKNHALSWVVTPHSNFRKSNSSSFPELVNLSVCFSITARQYLRYFFLCRARKKWTRQLHSGRVGNVRKGTNE